LRHNGEELGREKALQLEVPRKQRSRQADQEQETSHEQAAVAV
jgi:hypothetical protein